MVEENEMPPKYRLKEEVRKTDLKINRPFAIFVQESDETPGQWIAHVVGHELDNITFGRAGLGEDAGPEGAVENVADMLRCLTNVCGKSKDGTGEHDFSEVVDMAEFRDGGPIEGVKCSLCGSCEVMQNVEIVPRTFFLNEQHEVK